MVQEVNQSINKVKEVKCVLNENAGIESKTNYHETKDARGWGLLHWGVHVEIKQNKWPNYEANMQMYGN